jgi:hypothetical protein
MDGRINLEGTGSYEKYFIYSLLGQCVRYGQVNAEQFSLNLDLPAGTYCIVMQNQQNRRVEKILIY